MNKNSPHNDHNSVLLVFKDATLEIYKKTKTKNASRVK